MTISDIGPQAALVLIDLQEGLRAMPTNVSSDEIFKRAAMLARGFRSIGRPVVLVTVEPNPGSVPRRTDQARPQAVGSRPGNASEIVPELEAHADDIRIVKNSWGAFYGTALHEKLKALGITEIVLAGIATSIGVESTARAAYDHGYNIVIVSDAIADRDVVAHDNSIERIFPRLGRVGTVKDVLAAISVA